jgi:cell division protease FtsH
MEKETITGGEMVAIIEGRDPALVESPYASTLPRSNDIEARAKKVHMISKKIEAPEETAQNDVSEPAETPAEPAVSEQSADTETAEQPEAPQE